MDVIRDLEGLKKKKKKYDLHFPFLQSSSFHQRYRFHYGRNTQVEMYSRAKDESGSRRDSYQTNQKFETRRKRWIKEGWSVDGKGIGLTKCIVPCVLATWYVSPATQESHVDLTDVTLRDQKINLFLFPRYVNFLVRSQRERNFGVSPRTYRIFRNFWKLFISNSFETSKYERDLIPSLARKVLAIETVIRDLVSLSRLDFRRN